MVKLLASNGKIFHTKDVVKHLLFNIGEDIDGNFYPNHVDFYICFGTWHTEQGAIYIALTVTILFIFDLIVAIITHMWYFLPFIAFLIPFEFIMLYGIKKEKEKWILFHLIGSIVLVFVGFIILIFVCIAVITPKIFIYDMIESIFMTTNYQKIQLVCLLYAMALCITMSLIFWINWSLYIHYRYLKGLKAFTKRSQITVI